MTETVWISVIAASTGLLSPAFLAILTYFISRAQKREDYRRQDEVAAQARGVATVLASTNAVTAQKLDVLKEQGDATHALVNSNYSTIMETLLDSLIAQLVLMKKANNPAAEIQAIEKRIKTLQESLIERGRAADIIKAKAEKK